MTAVVRIAAMRCIAILSGMILLAGCVAIPKLAPPVAGPVAAPAGAAIAGRPLAVTAATSALRSGPALAAHDLPAAGATRALASFRESCRWLTTKEDISGLTRPPDWQMACEAARAWPDQGAAKFFADHFEPVQIGAGEAFGTGYFEPEIAGSRTPVAGGMPVYALPDDLVRGWPASTPADQREGRPPLGRYDADGRFVDYYDRATIEDGALAGRGLELAYAIDPIELFFLQIQGSGRLRFADGSVMRIGYAGQNGHGYTAIGAVMRERGLLGDGPGQYAPSMQGIMAYLREHPAKGRALMRENPSWVFFRELTGDGPLGSIGVPVRPRASVAVDPRFVPYGAPVWLDLERDVADGLWIAQDTGGAIKGANRFDTFWGAGEEAREIAGSMSASGKAWVLLPKGTLARLQAQ